jgi:UDP-N-acetylglucosamine:LPS N-acetylglucosamine transferase
MSILLFPYCLKAKRWLEENPPAVFIATHFLTAAGAVFARRWSKKLSYKVLLYATDPNDINSLWMWKGINCLIVSSERAKRRAVERGIKPDNIHVFGYPVRPSFFTTDATRSETQAELGLENGNLTLLISGGGQGLGKLDSLIYHLLEQDLCINLIVVCGKNGQLFNRLKDINTGSLHNTRLIPLGFVSNMDELIHVSDVVALKAGAASTYEALLLKKPVIFYEYVAQNELANIHFVVRNKIGWYAEKSEDLGSILEKLIGEGRNILSGIAERMDSLCLENGAGEIARFIVDNYVPPVRPEKETVNEDRLRKLN